MKRLMTAALAVTLMCGASAIAYAQDSQPPTAGDPSAAAPAQGSMPSGSMSPGSTASPPQGTDQSGQAPQGPMNGAQPPAGGDQGGAAPPSAPGDQSGAPPAGTATPPAAGDQGGAMPAPAAGAPDAGGSTVANAPDGAPPASYPVCTSKGQDRCIQSGKMTKGDGHTAKGHHHHTKAHHHHHMKKAMTSAPTASHAPASAPAPGA